MSFIIKKKKKKKKVIWAYVEKLWPWQPQFVQYLADT